MKTLMLGAAIVLTAMSPAMPTAAQKSALSGHQFDGVVSDAALRTAKRTRRDWLSKNPVGAKEYWAAWNCKGRPCDTQWYANIRAKAALIKRTDEDPDLEVENKRPCGSAGG